MPMPPSGSATAAIRPLSRCPLPRRVRHAHTLSQFDQEFNHLYTRQHRREDHAKGLLRATRARDNGRILRHLRKGTAEDPNFYRSIPATTFTEIVRLFSADRELTPITDSLEHTWWFPDRLHHLRTKAYQNAFAEHLRGLVDRRVDAGKQLSPLDLKLLLRSAGMANHVALATASVNEMKRHGYHVDVECFNSVMRAILYNRRGGSRMIGFTVNRLWYQSRAMGKLDWAPPPGQYVARIRNVYKIMLEAGGVANQETIILLMIAYARDAQTNKIARLLNAVWDVDIDAVLQGGQPPQPKPMEPGSPLMPTEELLLAIVEAYGTNSQTLTALALVDYLSSSYKIPISRRVWDALLVQVYVQSNPIQGRQINKSMHENPRLSLDAPVRLFGTMCAEPYKMTPNMISYYFVIKRATQAFRWIKAIDLIREAAKLYDQSAVEVLEARRGIERAKMRLAEGGVPSAPLSELAQRRETKLLEFRRSRVMIESLCHMFIKGGIVPGAFHVLDEADEAACTDPQGYAEDHPKGGYVVQPSWSFVGLPDFIKEFAHVLPPEVSYRTRTGFVRLQVDEDSTVQQLPAKPGELPQTTPLNNDMTRQIVHRKGFNKELAEYEMQLTGGYAYNPHRVLQRLIHYEDPPDVSLQDIRHGVHAP